MGTVEIVDSETLLSLSSIKELTNIEEIYQGVVGKFIYKKGSSLSFYDTIAKKTLKTLDDFTIKDIKSIKWNDSFTSCAIICDFAIFIMNKNFKALARICEGTNVLGGFWTKQGIFIYSTLHHIKYALSNGDNGIIKSTNSDCYPVALSKGKISILDINFKLNNMKVDLAEMEFKNAILHSDMPKVKKFIK